MYNLLLDKEFYTHLTTYQAQVNPEKIDDPFKRFKQAFYPHLEEYEEKQAKQRQKRLVDMSSKGTLLTFKPEKTHKQVIQDLREKAVQDAKKRYAPEPRRR